MTSSEQEQNKLKPKHKIIIILSILFFVVWIIGGIAAFIMSLVCFGKGGSTTEKVIGLLLAIFFGPFYFIYLYASSTYCKSI